MQVVATLPHPDCKITVFAWNGKYLLKLERGMLEQTYKVAEWDLTGAEDAAKLLDSVFMMEALERFISMQRSLDSALERL